MKEYWLVDPETETVSILRPRDGALVLDCTLGRGERLRAAVVAGFEVDLDDIFSS